MGEIRYFFSYARTDPDFVLKLAKELRAAGVNLWLDQLDILGGQRWDRAIQEALETCQGMIVVLSPESVASNNVMDEVSYALEQGKLVLPLLLRQCDIPFRLRRVQYVDFTTGYNAGFNQVLRALGTGPSAVTTQPTTPIVQAEAKRAEEEMARQLAEAKRVEEEMARQLAELKKTAEEERARQQAEAKRVEEEMARQQAEALERVIVGGWEVIINSPLGLVVSFSFQFDAGGSFSAQGTMPIYGIPTLLTMQGQWRAQNRVLVVQGVQMAGFISTPYAVQFTFGTVSSHELKGTTGVGEQVTFRRA